MPNIVTSYYNGSRTKRNLTLVLLIHFLSVPSLASLACQTMADTASWDAHKRYKEYDGKCYLFFQNKTLYWDQRGESAQTYCQVMKRLWFSPPIFSQVHASLYPALSIGWLVGWLVGRSVTLYFFLWFYFFDLTAPAKMVWWPQIWPLPTRTRLR